MPTTTKNKGRDALIADRRHRACLLKAEGLSYQEIANRLGHRSREHAFQDVQIALDTAQRKEAESVEHLRAVELARLDRMHAEAWRVMTTRHLLVQGGRVVRTGGDGDGEPLYDDGPTLEAIRTLLRVAERRSKLLGLDAPTRIEATGELKVMVVGVDVEELT